jgi:predicted lipoprotein with Yx(FWY)xxD motif
VRRRGQLAALTGAGATLTGVIVLATAGGSAASGTGNAAGRHASAAASSGAIVSVRRTRLGRILVDRRGRTLYLFLKDRQRRSACFGACAAIWPPLTTRGRPRARGGAIASKLGTTRRGRHTLQVIYNGHPLYLYAADSRPGQAHGQGVNAFGARWWVVSRAGRKITRSAHISPPPPPGYGPLPGY